MLVSVNEREEGVVALHLPMLVSVNERGGRIGLTPTHVGESVNEREEGIVA